MNEARFYYGSPLANMLVALFLDLRAIEKFENLSLTDREGFFLQLGDILSHMPSVRNADMVRRRFGLYPYPTRWTLDAIGKEYNMRGNTVDQLVERTIGKIRCSPGRMGRLRIILNLEQQPLAKVA